MQAVASVSTYATFVSSLNLQKLPKSKKVFDNSKITDHHAIIPTPVKPSNLTDMEKKVYDLIARRFIAVFFPDCKIATTTVLGDVNNVAFKATGKEILVPGWRTVFGKESDTAEKDDNENGVLPQFTQGENGPHVPTLSEKWTQPPKLYTEATLLRTMETAGKLVEDESLRDALKENGIGRPSTRAAIIETLIRRNYIRKEKKNLVATITGVELIDTIREELLKSAELTGIWENKLRRIERGEYKAADFLSELKTMVTQIVNDVRNDSTYRTITVEAKPEEMQKGQKTDKKEKNDKEKKKTTVRKNKKESSVDVPILCPLCKKGTILKGKSAYGCSEWRSGCNFRLNFDTCPADVSETELRNAIANYHQS